MAGIQKATAGTGPVVSVGIDRQYLAPFIAIILAAIVVGGALVVLNGMDRRAAPASAGAVTDGWLPSVTAANEAGRLLSADRVADGWSSRLLAGTATGDATDGWATRYLLAAPATGDATDGWATRYLVADD
jgi:hypothetical protein